MGARNFRALRGKNETVEPLRHSLETFRMPNAVGLCYEADHVFECLRDDLIESPIISHEHSRRICAILDEIWRQLNVRYPQDEV